MNSGNTLLEHESVVQSSDVDSPAVRSIVESARSLSVSFEVKKHWGSFLSVSNQTFLNNDESDSRGSHVLLGSGVNKVVSVPINRSGANVRAHIANNWHALRDLLPGEIVLYFNSMNCLVVAEVEVSAFGIDIPLRSLRNSLENSFLRICPDFIYLDVLGSLSLSLLGPGSSGEIVGDLFVFLQVEGESGEDAGGTSLEEEDLEVVRDVQKLFQVLL